MASELRVNTLKDASGNNSVAMEYVAGGSAKAWANHNNTGTVVLNANLNVSSLSDIETGVGQLSFSNAMSDAYYSATHGGNQSGSQTTGGGVEDIIFTGTQATGSVYVIQKNGSTATDFASVNTTIHGDLA